MSDSEFREPKYAFDQKIARQTSADRNLAKCTDVTHGIEKFTAGDLATLRSELLQSGIDSFQAAELVTVFLGGRGYGISRDEARTVAGNIDGHRCTVERIEAELVRVARVA